MEGARRLHRALKPLSSGDQSTLWPRSIPNSVTVKISEIIPYILSIKYPTPFLLDQLNLAFMTSFERALTNEPIGTVLDMKLPNPLVLSSQFIHCAGC